MPQKKNRGSKSKRGGFGGKQRGGRGGKRGGRKGRNNSSYASGYDSKAGDFDGSQAMGNYDGDESEAGYNEMSNNDPDWERKVSMNQIAIDCIMDFLTAIQAEQVTEDARDALVKIHSLLRALHSKHSHVQYDGPEDVKMETTSKFMGCEAQTEPIVGKGGGGGGRMGKQRGGGGGGGSNKPSSKMGKNRQNNKSRQSTSRQPNKKNQRKF